MSKGNLLLIDDEKDLLDSLHALLEGTAEKTWTAESGMHALEILKKEQVDCIICDVRMPGMDGLQVIQKVREMGIDVPFIFFTAHGNEDIMLEAVKYGAFDFVNKPFFENLEEIVKNGLVHGVKQRTGALENQEEIVQNLQQLMKKN